MKKLLPYLLTLALFACNSGTSSSSSNFTITSITPANGAAIPVNQSFVAIFSNNLNLATVGNVSLKTESGASILIDCTGASSNSIICTPVSPLNYSTGYTLTYGSGIQNAAGNNLTQTVYNYKTFDNQGLSSIVPSSGSINPNSTNWNFQFSESMQVATLNTSQTPDNVVFYQNSANQVANKSLNAASNIAITCTSSNPQAMNCSLSESQLTPGESYTLVLTDKIVNSNGVPIVPQTLNYVTDNYITPTVSVSPASGTVGLNQLSYTLTFNTTMQLTTINNNIIFTDTTDPTQIIKIACSSTDNVKVVCGLSDLTQLIPNHNYQLSLGSGISSTQNIALAPTTFNYNAGSYVQPVINFITPPSGAISPTQLSYNLQFNTAMDMPTFAGNVIFLDTTSTNAISVNCTSNDSINVLCTLSGVSQLTANHNYTLSFNSNIKAKSQAPLATTSYSYAASSSTVPTIQYINPNPGAIGLSQLTYTAKFNTIMNMSTFASNVTFVDTTISSSLSISCTSSDNLNVQCALQGISQLVPNHDYKLNFGAGVKSAQGIAITSTSYNYSATNFTIPNIVSITPTAGAISLTQTTFMPQFSESMNISTFAGNVTFTDSTTGGKINVLCSSTDSVTVVCALQGVTQLTYQHNYTLNFGTGILSNQGVPISSTTYNYSASNATIPQVSSISPTSNSQVNYGTQVFTISFSVAMNTATFSNITMTAGKSTLSLSCTPTNSTTASCTASNIVGADSLTLRLPSTILSAQGVPLTSVTYYYTTPPLPAIASTSPVTCVDGEWWINCQISITNDYIIATINFNMPMDTSTFTNNNVTVVETASNTASAGPYYLTSSCSGKSSTSVTCYFNGVVKPAQSGNCTVGYNFQLNVGNVKSSLGVPYSSSSTYRWINPGAC